MNSNQQAYIAKLNNVSNALQSTLDSCAEFYAFEGHIAGGLPVAHGKVDSVRQQAAAQKAIIDGEIADSSEVANIPAST